MTKFGIAGSEKVVLLALEVFLYRLMILLSGNQGNGSNLVTKNSTSMLKQNSYEKYEKA